MRASRGFFFGGGRLIWNLIYRPGWPQTHINTPASAFQVLRFQAYATTNSGIVLKLSFIDCTVVFPPVSWGGSGRGTVIYTIEYFPSIHVVAKLTNFCPWDIFLSCHSIVIQRGPERTHSPIVLPIVCRRSIALSFLSSHIGKHNLGGPEDLERRLFLFRFLLPRRGQRMSEQTS